MVWLSALHLLRCYGYCVGKRHGKTGCFSYWRRSSSCASSTWLGSKRRGLRPLPKGRLKTGLDVVPEALTCLGCFSSKLPQNCHPERSASQLIASHSALRRGVEGPRR